jgi:hypothetical protein
MNTPPKDRKKTARKPSRDLREDRGERQIKLERRRQTLVGTLPRK